MAVTYWEKLKDPRWQRKRLEVLNRAGFACENCYDTESTLHVHHGFYEKGHEPWDYPLETLWCLCEDCHSIAEECRRDVYLELARMNPCSLCPTLIVDLQSPLDLVRMIEINPRLSYRIQHEESEALSDG